MLPHDFTDNKLKAKTIPDIYYWGFLLNCWDCFQEFQDLRSVCTFVVRDLSRWISKEKKYINDKELEWCKTIADIDAENAVEDKEIIKQWSMDYAVVTVVMRKFLVKSWKSSDFISSLENKRLEYEVWVRENYNDSVDWHLPNVSCGERSSVMEKKLKKLVNETANNTASCFAPDTTAGAGEEYHSQIVFG